VGATDRLVLFPTWLLPDLLGVCLICWVLVMFSTLGYEQNIYLNVTFIKKAKEKQKKLYLTYR